MRHLELNPGDRIVEVIRGNFRPGTILSRKLGGIGDPCNSNQSYTCRYKAKMDDGNVIEIPYDLTFSRIQGVEVQYNRYCDNIEKEEK